MWRVKRQICSRFSWLSTGLSTAVTFASMRALRDVSCAWCDECKQWKFWKCYEIFRDGFIANFPESVTVKEFLKSVNIWCCCRWPGNNFTQRRVPYYVCFLLYVASVDGRTLQLPGEDKSAGKSSSCCLWQLGETPILSWNAHNFNNSGFANEIRKPAH